MRSVLFFLLISLFFGGNISAQTIQETYASAEAFSTQGQYAEALKLYKRLVFFVDENDSIKPNLYVSAAKAFTETKQYAKAADFYSNAIYLSANDSLSQTWRIQRIKALLLHHEFRLAKTEILKIDTIKFPALKPSVYFYTAIYYFGQEEYDSSHTYFAKTIGYQPGKQRQLDKLFRKNQRIKYTNASTAAVMSVIIPGSGQIYTGNFNKGMYSFLLTSGFAILGYNTYAAYGLLEALVSVSPWYLRYYTSGIKNAAELAKQRQAQKRQKVFTQMLMLLPPDVN